MLGRLVDESVPAAFVHALRTRGVDAVTVQEVALRGQPDEVIAARALAEQRLMVTVDIDYRILSANHFPQWHGGHNKLARSRNSSQASGHMSTSSTTCLSTGRSTSFERWP